MTGMASGLVVLLFLYNHSISLSLLKIIVILGLGLMAGLQRAGYFTAIRFY
jgi:hypothetical protein